MELSFEYEKDTKNTVRFKEVDTNIVGTVYIQKQALNNLNYQQGDNIKINIIVEGEQKHE